jgi:hypothetical protein
MRVRKPWVLARWRRLGWKVRFGMTKNSCAGQTPAQTFRVLQQSLSIPDWTGFSQDYVRWAMFHPTFSAARLSEIDYAEKWDVADNSPWTGSRNPIRFARVLPRSCKKVTNLVPTRLPSSHIFAAGLLLGSVLSFAGQTQRTLVVGDGQVTHDVPVPHPLAWWTHDPLELDESGDLLIGRGHTLTTRDYQVEQKVTTLA